MLQSGDKPPHSLASFAREMLAETDQKLSGRNHLVFTGDSERNRRNVHALKNRRLFSDWLKSVERNGILRIHNGLVRVQTCPTLVALPSRVRYDLVILLKSIPSACR